MSRPGPFVALAGALIAGGCAGHTEVTLPSALSHPTSPAPGGLHAGFGRADITPPPGVPLAGNGFEGQQAEGYRMRLYARALVLEDADGERIALVVADLPHVSLLLHRRAAEATLTRTGIGADRLFLSATHTHSGPGNHYGASQYNAQASARPGFDPALTRFLVDGIEAAVREAVDDLRPAVAGWGRREVRGVTRNRSLEPHRANDPSAAALGASDAVDDTLRMLRVDQCRVGWAGCRPRGAFSSFAIHGTVLPPANTLFDADVQGVVARGLERAIDAARRASSTDETAPGARASSAAIHLFANGAEGDVSPDFSEDSRCGPNRRLSAGGWVGGPRAPEPAERWVWRAGEPAACLAAARREADRLGATITTVAAALHDEIGTSGRLSRSVAIARAFRTIDLIATPGLCAPRSGVSTFGGAEDARTRLFEWRLLGLDLGMREGGSAARDRPAGCQGHKTIGLHPVQGWIVGSRGLPTHAQLAVVRIGDGLVLSVPGEVTTAAGRAMRAAVRDSGPVGIEHTAVLGLANGYLQYVATEPEYALQHYEGGSTLYGPKLAEVIRTSLAELATAVRDGRDVAVVDPVIVDPGGVASYVPPADQGPDPTSISRSVTGLVCTASGIEATWVDLYPGRFRVHAGPVLEIQRRVGMSWEPVARDDEASVLVRAHRPRGTAGFEWGVTWETPTPPPTGTYRLFLAPRLGMPTPPAAGSGRTADCR